MSEDEQKRREDADMAIVSKAASGLGEHFDSVQIFVTRLEDDATGTTNICYGSGNWFTRFGQVSEWLVRVNEDTRVGRRMKED